MKIVSFSGRIGRSAFLLMTVLLYIFAFVFGLVMVIGGFSVATDFPAKDVPAGLREMNIPVALAWTFFIVGFLGFATVVLGLIGLSVRRLHDFGLTGFLVLLYPVLKHVIPDTGWPDWLPGPADLLWFLIMIAQPGTRGPNAFGPDPRAPLVSEGDAPTN